MNSKVIILGIISIAIGAWLNDYSTRKNNEKLLAAFKAELEAYNKAKQVASPTQRIAIDQKQEILQAQINLLESLT